jgi:hypothetical protein
MSEKKPKSKRAKQQPKSVMENLPSTRPTRMSRHRDANGDAGEAQAKAAAPRKPRAAARPKAAAPGPRAAAKPKAAASGPRAVRSGSPSLKTAAPKSPPKPPQSQPPKGAELVTTAVQATGELAQIGVKLGVRAAKRAVQRLPKP